MRRFPFGQRHAQSILAAAAALLLSSSLPSGAARVNYVPQPPATAYRYGGFVYDRLFAALAARRRVAAVMPARVNHPMGSPVGTPYTIEDLGVLTGLQFESGAPLAIDNAGDITYFDDCECNGDGGSNFAYLIHKDGTYTTLFDDTNGYDILSAEPYAINNVGDEAGVWSYRGAQSYFKAHASWGPPGRTRLDPSSLDDGSFALAVNDADMSVGQAPINGATTAALFEFTAAGGSAHPKPLLPPKNTHWIGTATGINDANEIVGYAQVSPGFSRAVRFFIKGTAVVIPVAPAGTSSSAQAINQHGDVAGSAGSEAFLYRYNRTTYLPRPTGDEAGNAVAYALNASDEVVGNISSATGSTAFLYVNGQSYDLNSLVPASAGWVITGATGINDAGEIIGYGYQPSESGPLNSGTFEMLPNVGTASSGAPLRK